MERFIEVSHLNGAWRLLVSGLEPMFFLSGARAERAARRLAYRLAGAGCEARVRIRDLQNVIVGDHRYFAALVRTS